MNEGIEFRRKRSKISGLPGKHDGCCTTRDVAFNQDVACVRCVKRSHPHRQLHIHRAHLLSVFHNISISPGQNTVQPFLAISSQAQNGFPRLARPVFRRGLPVRHVTWTASTTNTDGLPPSCSPLPLLQHANRPHNSLTQPPLNYLSQPQDHLSHARFCFHFQLVSRLYIAVLTYTSGLSLL